LLAAFRSIGSAHAPGSCGQYRDEHVHSVVARFVSSGGTNGHHHHDDGCRLHDTFHHDGRAVTFVIHDHCAAVLLVNDVHDGTDGD